MSRQLRLLQVEEVVSQELLVRGEKFEDIFAEFDPIPLVEAIVDWFNLYVVCIPITGFVYDSALLKSILSNTVDRFNGFKPKPKIRLQFVNFNDLRLFFASIAINTFFKSSSDIDHENHVPECHRFGIALCKSIQSNVSH